MNVRSLARALGGDIVSPYQVVAPGPGHSPKDRSLSVFIDGQAPQGFRVHSHAVPRDDWQACRDYVKQRLGTDSEPHRLETTSRHREPVKPDDTDRISRAISIWQEARR